MQAIGYRHMQAVVDGLDTLVNALAAIETDTRRFARRQRTWLRAVPEVRWYDPADADQISEQVGRFLEASESSLVSSADGEPGLAAEGDPTATPG
jgi:tRNA A37 N6-isopentenylltransferase MiaA